MTDETLADYARLTHIANKRWWTDIQTGEPYERNVGELLMLTISELSEALEGHRKDLPDDKLPHRSMLEVELADTLIRTLDMIGGLNLKLAVYLSPPLPFGNNIAENLLRLAVIYVEVYQVWDRESPWLISERLAVAVRGLEDLASKLGLDLETAMVEKLAYNATRHDHTNEGRLAAGGKKY